MTFGEFLFLLQENQETLISLRKQHQAEMEGLQERLAQLEAAHSQLTRYD